MTEPEVRRAIKQMEVCLTECEREGDQEAARATQDTLRALQWVVEDPSPFGDLLDALERIDRARRQ